MAEQCQSTKGRKAGNVHWPGTLVITTQSMDTGHVPNAGRKVENRVNDWNQPSFPHYPVPHTTAFDVEDSTRHTFRHIIKAIALLLWLIPFTSSEQEKNLRLSCYPFLNFEIIL